VTHDDVYFKKKEKTIEQRRKLKKQILARCGFINLGKKPIL